MTDERKEGILIIAGVLVILCLLAAWTNWSYGLQGATFSFEGFTRKLPDECKEVKYPENSIFQDHQSCWARSEQIMSFYIRYTTALGILMPIFIYGLLRAFGIIRRLFRFESVLSRLLPRG